MSGSAGRMRFPTEGADGGKRGAHGWIAINDEPIAPTSAPEIRFGPGDVLRLKVPGGGGHGNPSARPGHEVERDLQDGYISEQSARDDYAHRG